MDDVGISTRVQFPTEALHTITWKVFTMMWFGMAMMVFSKEQIRHLKSHELCHLATVSKRCVPHVTAVVYGMDGEHAIMAIDCGTKKLQYVKENTRVSFAVDTYKPNAGVMVRGKCLVIEKGGENRRLLRILFNRFDFYRKNPWREGNHQSSRLYSRGA